MEFKKVLKYYSREDIQKELIKAAKDKEVIGSCEGKYLKRPDSLEYPKDIVESVKQGVTSFHASEELWKNPLQLDVGMKRKELDALRTGWDLILDIDCSWFEYSKITADLLVKALKHHGVSLVSCKFSGNKGFHIGVPFEAFPSSAHGRHTKELFPEGPRKIAHYLRELIKEPLSKNILKLGGINTIMKRTGKSFNDIVKNNKLNPYSLVTIDTILISPRHLYRMPYSLHEKSGLVSIPIDPDDIYEFDKKDAEIDNVQIKYDFLNRDVKDAEAKKLIIEAFDFSVKEEQIRTTNKKYSLPEDAVHERFFPPCIKFILQGLEDGRKRSLFILINFLTSIGWSYGQIDKLLKEWNKKNKESLSENYTLGQLRYHKNLKKKVPPPNCSNTMYYKDIDICRPDNLCKKIKNPINYAIRKSNIKTKTK